MTNQAYEREVERAEASHVASARKPSGVFRLLGGSALLMSVVLPLGIVPRLMQAQELEHSHGDLVNQVAMVTVTPAKAAPAVRSLKLPGSIEAIVETAVYARSNGYVSKRAVDIGDRVQTGQLLARIDTPEINQAALATKALLATNVAAKAQTEANRDSAQADLDKSIAELSQAKADLIEKESEQKLANSTYQRWKQLGADGAVAKQDVDERETKLKTTTAERESASNRVKAAQSAIVANRAKLKAEAANVDASAANIDAARAQSKRSTTEQGFQEVFSPFSGIITERNFDTGTLISSGSDTSKVPLYRLARIDTVRVFVDVPQFAAPGVRVGQQVQVALSEFPGRVFKGVVARTSVALDPTARTLRTEVHLPNPQLLLAPGMYADVSFDVPRSDNALLIPANALVTRSEGQQVAIVSPDNKAHFRKISVANDLGKELEVTSGISAGDKLILNPSDAVIEGAPVTITK